MSSSGLSSTASLPAIFLSWRRIEESIDFVPKIRSAPVDANSSLADRLNCKPLTRLESVHLGSQRELAVGQTVSFQGIELWRPSFGRGEATQEIMLFAVQQRRQAGVAARIQFL